MKKNRITILITILLIVIAAGLYFTSSYTTLRRGVSEFAIRDTASITKIFLADKNNQEVLLVKDDHGQWILNNKYPAQPMKVQSFLKTLRDIQVRNPVPLAARDNVIKRMSVVAKKVEIYQSVPRINLFDRIRLFYHETNTKTYYVGDVTQDNQGTFMLMEGAEEPFVVNIPGFRGFVASRYSTNTYDWRDYTVFRTPLGDIRSVRVEFPIEQKESYQFDLDEEKHIRLTELSSMQPVTAFDTVRTLNFLTGFQDIRFESLLESLLEKTFIDSVLSSTPKIIITLTDQQGKVFQAKIFNKKGFADITAQSLNKMEPVDLDRGYALVNDGEDFVLIQYYTFDRITRNLSYFTRKEPAQVQ